MNKRLKLLLTVAVLLLSVCACSEKKVDNKDVSEKPSIVTTIFPEYDWVKQIVKGQEDRFNITFLMDKGTDLHSYQPSVEDITRISDCDVFIYVGGESDAWVENVLKQAKNKNMKTINLVEILGDKAKEEEVVEGMEAEHDEDDDDHEDGHHHEHEDGEAEIDEHVWLSLRNAQMFVKEIGAALENLDPACADTYKNNTKAYIDKLAALDADYVAMVNEAPHKTVVFGDRFPFRYLTEDLDLKYYAAFVGCSAETEASFETISFLAGKVDELGLNTVLAIEGKDHKIAETVAKTAKRNASVKVVTLNSMQGTTAKDAEKGIDYYSIMQSNLEVLKEALK